MRVTVRRTSVHGVATEHSAFHGTISGVLVAMLAPGHLMVRRDNDTVWRSQHPIVAISGSTKSAEVWCATQMGQPAALVALADQGLVVIEVYKVKFVAPAEPSSARTPSRHLLRRRVQTPKSGRPRALTRYLQVLEYFLYHPRLRRQHH